MFSSTVNDIDLKKILSAAAHSPSSHNTQPWTIKMTDGALVVGFRAERQLRVGDPDKRELFISLGCFIESIALASRDLNFDVSFRFISDKPERVGTITFVRRKTNTDSTKWIPLIRNRRSDRRYFEDKKLPLDDLAILENMAYGESSLLVTDNLDNIKYLTSMTKQATLKIMLRQDFRNELAGWVRNNWTRKHDGMPGYSQGMPGPISLLAKFVIKKTKSVAKDQAKKDSGRIQHSSAVGLVCLNSESPENWINAGRLYQKTCLVALSLGIKTSGVSAAVIDPQTTKLIQKRLGFDSTPVALMRFGYTKNIAKASPRLKPYQFTQS